MLALVSRVDALLGEMMGEARGKIIGMRALNDGKVEASFQGSGKFLGIEITDIGTYQQTLRTGGVLYGEGTVILMTKDGETVTWTGMGVGKLTGQGMGARYAACGSYQTSSQKLARLNSVIGVVEYEVDENGNYHWETWEWKH